MTEPADRIKGPTSVWQGQKVYRVTLEPAGTGLSQCRRFADAPCVFDDPTDGRSETIWSTGCNEHECMKDGAEESIWLLEPEALRVKLLGVP